MHLDNLNKGKETERPKGQHGKNKKKFSCYNCGKEGHMARDCRSKDTNKVKRHLNVLRRASELNDDESWNVVTKAAIRYNHSDEDLVKGLEDITFTTSEQPSEEEEPLSDEEYETPEEEEEPPTTRTKHEKMASFKEKHRPATPRLKRQDSALPESPELVPSPLRLDNSSTCDRPEKVEEQINQLRRLLNKEEVAYDYDGNEPSVLLHMYQDLWNLRSDIDFYEIPVQQTIPSYNYITANIARLKEELARTYDPSQSHSPQWARKARQHWERSNLVNPYWHDARNAGHAKISWTACTHDYCPAHYSDKQGAGWMPKTGSFTPSCKWKWFECQSDICPVHLWDKREKKYFPGHEDPRDIIDMQITYEVQYEDKIDNECNQVHWQTCLCDKCDKHAVAKDYYGFGQRKSFLGQRHESQGPPGRSTQ
jgi:hypothetical protein